MTADPRAALASLIGCFERHLEAAASRSGENDPSVVAAYQDLADAFEAYDDALLDAYAEVTPLEVYSDDDDDDEDDEDDDDEDESGGADRGADGSDDLDDDDDDEDGIYVGLAESDFDEDTRRS